MLANLKNHYCFNVADVMCKNLNDPVQSFFNFRGNFIRIFFDENDLNGY